MTQDQQRHERVQAIFLRACPLSGDERAAYLNEACGGDPGLLQEVEGLLAHDPGSLEQASVSVHAGSGKADDSTRELLGRISEHSPPKSRYKLEGEIARGGMGTILRVWDEDLRRHLAMKVVLGKGEAKSRGDTPDVDPRTLGRFLEEAQVTGQLDHPGIVPIHELGLDAEGRVYFTMKLVKGKTLKEVFDKLAKGEGGWTQTRVLGLILKVCEAMSYAHAKGVIHRDLKPANIMVGRFGEVYVMDWGLAKILGREDEKDIRIQQEQALTTGEVRSDRRDRVGETPDSPLYTMDGDVVGTPAYMPPEQAAGDIPAIGPHSDVYAVGAMLYHLLAGHMPYVRPSDKASNYAVWRWVREGPPTQLAKEAADAPAELVAICERAMVREVGGRYSRMSALADDLSAYIEGRVVSAYETGAWAETKKWMQRNKPLAGSLAAAVVLLAAGLVVSLTQKARADAKTLEAQSNLTLALSAQAEEKAQRDLAQRNEAEAQTQRDIARAETAKVLRLSDVKVLQELEDEADDLWPAYHEQIGQLASWLDRARELADNLPGHRETLAEMRRRAHPWSDEERVRDRETHPRAEERAEKQAELEGLIEQLEQGLEREAQEQADARVAELELEISLLTEEIESRRTWSFDTPEDQWQHDVLTGLIGSLEALETGLLAEDAITENHGWSVPKRLGFAQVLEAGYAEGGGYAEAWEGALPAIREAYPGLGLKPQMGLLPIGPDPESGLWEFAHLMTGEPPERGPDGKLVLTEETGVVLVLLRGGTFWMGAQSGDPNGQNHDPQARTQEGPVHEVELSAYFLSKYELTQGQWRRMTGRNPSFYQPPDRLAPTLLHPVEQVSWQDCMTWLPRTGLALPSESQWEYGARAGTETPWWTGAERESLRDRHAANLADQAAAREGARWTMINDWPGLDDGYAAHAPVGTYAPNSFGLHEVAGNLWEWCLDGFDRSFYGNSPRLDPVAPPLGGTTLVRRGGSLDFAAFYARSAYRSHNPPTNTSLNLGTRPARAIDP